MEPYFSTISSLPIVGILPDIIQALNNHNCLVIQAPPGAGKTTGVPLSLLDQPWVRYQDKTGRIIMLEPRRLAARAAARRMADILGEAVGQTVGYRVRLDHKVSDKTRIEVVTEGVLIRMLQKDPELSGISAVIIDEFHERSLEADLALALCLDVQQGLRDDLKLIVMSATLDGERVAQLMGDAPIVTSKGRAFPVEIRYLDRTIPVGRQNPIEQSVATLIHNVVNSEPGSLLVFLPGAGEIERCAELLRRQNLGPEVVITPLYGKMRGEEQDGAILPAPVGKRKIVLATAIAETSLTIEGIRIVIDGGQERSPRYDVPSGMTRLETRMLSRASADQRAGRAGRLEPGICYRMWTAAAQRGLASFAAPEITKADLVPLTLELADWGVVDPLSLRWMDGPDQAAISKARDLLYHLGAMDAGGRITPHGQKMARLAMHPRLAHMVLVAQHRGFGSLALRIAALLSERDILRDRSADMRLRLSLLDDFLQGVPEGKRQQGVDQGLLSQIRRQLVTWERSLKIPTSSRDLDKTGICLALVYPDRIGGKRPGGQARYILSGGRGAVLDPMDDLCGEKYLAICHLDRGDREARVYLAAPLTDADIEDFFQDQIREISEIGWDDRSNQVLARTRRMLGQLPLKELRLETPDETAVLHALCEGIRLKGLDVLPWDKASRSFRNRLLFCRKYDPDGDWPDVGDAYLLERLEQWLGPYISGMKRLDQVKQVKLLDILKGMLDWEQSRKLDQLVPSHFTVPSGSDIALDYSQDPPVLAVRLQEMFGLQETPTVMAGKCRLLVHLLSPAQRPLQVTQDLENFWSTSYEAVKKEMKGRYPKHHWPDNPHEAVATRRVKSRS